LSVMLIIIDCTVFHGNHHLYYLCHLQTIPNSGGQPNRGVNSHRLASPYLSLSQHQ
jgi:hypothetical protein